MLGVLERTGSIFSGRAPPKQFYQLYEKTARALKSADPDLKVGRPAIADPAHVSEYRECILETTRLRLHPDGNLASHTVLQ